MFDTIHHFQQLDSCVGSNSCGVYFNTAPSDTNGLSFGATHLASGGTKAWLADSNSTVTYDMGTTTQGMWSSGTGINAYWSDTTAMDNLRAADITATSVAGSLETIGGNTTATNVRGGHTVHIGTTEGYFGVEPAAA
jgi:hypothetical protein